MLNATVHLDFMPFSCIGTKMSAFLHLKSAFTVRKETCSGCLSVSGAENFLFVTLLWSEDHIMGSFLTEWHGSEVFSPRYSWTRTCLHQEHGLFPEVNGDFTCPDTDIFTPTVLLMRRFYPWYYPPELNESIPVSFNFLRLDSNKCSSFLTYNIIPRLCVTDNENNRCYLKIPKKQPII